MTSLLFKRPFLRIALAFLALTWSALGFALEPLVKAPQVDKPTRVLFVGNSYFYYNNSLHNHVSRLLSAADPALEKRIEFKSATIGGAVAAHHNLDYLTKPGQIGVKQSFELLILQGGSNEGLSEKHRAAYRQTVLAAKALLEPRGIKLALYMPHAYVAPNAHVHPDNLKLTADMLVSVGNEVQALVIPVGLAFEEAYRQRPSLQLHNQVDGSHPSLIGTYLAACTVLASVYGISPFGNSYDYYGAIDRETASFLQKVAQETVSRFNAGR